MRILVVDDEFVSLSKLEKILEKYGKCDAATSGDQAFEMFKQAFEESRPYSLITLDIDMPGLTGQEVTAKIRQWEDEHEIYQTYLEVKILMVTGMSDSRNLLSSFREGCEGYVIKPFDSTKIHDALAKLGFTFSEED